MYLHMERLEELQWNMLLRRIDGRYFFGFEKHKSLHVLVSQCRYINWVFDFSHK